VKERKKERRARFDLLSPVNLSPGMHDCFAFHAPIADMFWSRQRDANIPSNRLDRLILGEARPPSTFFSLTKFSAILSVSSLPSRCTISDLNPLCL